MTTTGTAAAGPDVTDGAELSSSPTSRDRPGPLLPAQPPSTLAHTM